MKTPKQDMVCYLDVVQHVYDMMDQHKDWEVARIVATALYHITGRRVPNLEATRNLLCDTVQRREDIGPLAQATLDMLDKPRDWELWGDHDSA